MNPLHWAARHIPPIRRLSEGRDALLRENDGLRAALARQEASTPALSAADVAAARLEGERLGRATTLEAALGVDADRAAAIRLAAQQNRLFVTDYAYFPHERPLAGSASGRQLAARFTADIPRISETLRGIARHAERLGRIGRTADSPIEPNWDNPWFPPFDGASLYGILAETAPRRFIEVGSGISTRFARRAIRDLGLATQIISIDPHPHNPLGGLCDETIVARMEDMPASFWAELTPGDMVFIDNSHRSFPGSDVTVFFGEVMPALPQGVVFGIHDIFLPHDYPEAWKERFYSEQYLLMTYLLGGAGRDEILLPVNWASSQPELHGILNPLWQIPGLFDGLTTHGGCFWMRRGPAA
jgi:hypothetical protein